MVSRLESIAREILPPRAQISWLAESQDYQPGSRAFLYAFVLALVIVFLVLAAQLESFIQPVVLLALLIARESVNIFSQIGFILAIGIMARNAVLLVELANQLRDYGQGFDEALTEGAPVRFRPILMISIGTFFGALPLALAIGPGARPAPFSAWSSWAAWWPRPC